jgi:hypothetical protein
MPCVRMLPCVRMCCRRIYACPVHGCFVPDLDLRRALSRSCRHTWHGCACAGRACLRAYCAALWAAGNVSKRTDNARKTAAGHEGAASQRRVGVDPLLGQVFCPTRARYQGACAFEGRQRGVVTQNCSRSMRQDTADGVSDFADTRVQYFHGKPADPAGCENDARVLR